MNNYLYTANLHVKAALSTMTTANGYNYTAAKVQAGADSEPKAGAHVYIVSVTLEQVRNSFNCMRGTATYKVRGVVAGMAGELDEKGLKMWADIEKAMQSCAATVIESVTCKGGDMTFQRDADAATVELNFEVSLYWAANAP